MAHLQQLPFIKIDNEDDSYYTFLKHLDSSQLIHINSMRCHRVPPPASVGSKLKRYNIDFEPSQGSYQLTYKDHPFLLKIERGAPKITTECRTIEYLKEITIHGETLELLKEFLKHVYSLAQAVENEHLITIYQNNGGHWMISKEKIPRKLESVIFQKQFVNDIIGDIQEFVDSQGWYTEMGIPYKRSYLLYGPPGTGKSSLAQAVAAEIKFSICFVNCSDNINDFNFNRLLNTAPKKSIILVEDVDSIFSERRNAQKLNSLTFSGFLNAIDGVRSQEGRIIIMTTNFKERLDPALLRPGRTDEMFQIGLASKYQIEKLCLRFYKDQQLAKQFSEALPEGKFAMSMIQGFLLKHRKNPSKIMEKLDDLLQNDENVKIDQFLNQIGCQECLNDFKMEECFTLASAKNLPKTEIEKITAKLSPLLKGRLIQNLRGDRKAYLRTYSQLQKCIEELASDEHIQRELRFYCQESKCTSIFQLKDKLREINQQVAQKNL